MNGRKPLFLASTLVAYASTATAQTFGGELTVEESLIEFTNTVTTFQVETAGEVLLFIVMPIIGFYFLIKNFTSMGYETFEERIGRHDYYAKDEEIPTGMKGFSLVASATTVLTLGSISSGLLALAGVAALGLAGIIYTGLIPSRKSVSPSAPEPQPEPEPEPNQSQQQSFEAHKQLGEELVKTGKELEKGYNKRNQQRQDKNFEEALRYFESDMLSEINHVVSNYSKIENIISNAEDDLTDTAKNSPDTFKSLTHRSGLISKLLDDYVSQSPATIDSFHSSTKPDRDFKKEIYNLENQIKRCLKSESITPPDDVFNDLLDELNFIVASAHFMHYCPIEMSRISSDRSEAKKVISQALNLGKVQNQSGRDEVEELMRLGGWLDKRSDILKDIIIRSERLSKREMKISQAEMNHIKKLVERDGNIHTKLKNMKKICSKNPNISKELSNDIVRAESKMSDIDNELASLESRVSAHGEFESQVYKKLKKLERAM